MQLNLNIWSVDRAFDFSYDLLIDLEANYKEQMDRHGE